MAALQQWDVLTERGLASTPNLDVLWSSPLPTVVEDLVYLPAARPHCHDLGWAQSLIYSSDWQRLPNLIPLLPVK